MLLPAVLSTLALSSVLVDDGCDYARLTGPSVEVLTGSPSVPFVECGMMAYRVPGYYPDAVAAGRDTTTTGAWRVAYTDECVPYDPMDVYADAPWVAARWLRFASLVSGCASTAFLWTSACLSLRPNYWRGAGIGIAFACLLQACSFVWFRTRLCHSGATNFDDFASGREVEGHDRWGDEYETSDCGPFFGSRCAIASCALWATAAAIVLLGRYPAPVPKYLVQDYDDVVYGDDTDERLFSTTIGGGGQQAAMLSAAAVGGRGNGGSSRALLDQKTRRKKSVTVPWVSGAPPPLPSASTSASHHGTGAGSLRTSMRPNPDVVAMNGGNNERSREFTGSAFSAVSFC